MSKLNPIPVGWSSKADGNDPMNGSEDHSEIDFTVHIANCLNELVDYQKVRNHKAVEKLNHMRVQTALLIAIAEKLDIKTDKLTGEMVQKEWDIQNYKYWMRSK